MKYKLNIQFTSGEIKESYFGWGTKVKQESRSKSLTEALEFLEVSGDVCCLRPQSSIEQRDDVKADKKKSDLKLSSWKEKNKTSFRVMRGGTLSQVWLWVKPKKKKKGRQTKLRHFLTICIYLMLSTFHSMFATNLHTHTHTQLIWSRLIMSSNI